MSLGEPFSLRVDARFVAPGLWLVHAVIAYARDLDLASRSAACAEARMRLHHVVSREVRRGWEERARRVSVLVEGDRQVAGLFEALDGDSSPAIVA